jgi:hypothetical protein
VLETIKIKSNATAQGFLIINKSDFDPEAQEVWSPEPPKPPKNNLEEEQKPADKPTDKPQEQKPTDKQQTKAGDKK